jgi:hypothetical protein
MGARSRQVRVIGVPRSGTNLVKYLIENNSDIRCHFNYGWWKHAVIPPVMDRQESIVDDLPTIIVFRDPLIQIASFFKFSSKGPTAISGAADFGAFIKSPIRMTPNRDYIEYYFGAPIEYWKQFYYAALKWRNPRKIFVDLEDLQLDPHLIMAALERDFPGAGDIIPTRPNNYLGRNPDRNLAEHALFEASMSLDHEKQLIFLLIGSLSDSEKAFIRSDDTTLLFDELRKARFCT